MRQTVFLYQLVLRILVLATERLDREELRYAALTAQLGLALSDESFLGSRAEALTKIGAAAMTWATELRAHETARARVEAEYFEGTSTLYPATLRRWTEQRELSDGLVDLIARLAELDGLDPLPVADPDAFAARVDQLVADHVEPARVKALDELGEGRRAVLIAMRWLGAETARLIPWNWDSEDADRQGASTTGTGVPCCRSSTTRSPSGAASVAVAVRRAPTAEHAPIVTWGCRVTMTTTARSDSTASAV